MQDVVMIGAGVGGLACAADLQAQGLSVAVLDKGRAPSGRCSTRTYGLPDGAPIDHGARYFTARSRRFQAFAEAGVQSGWLRVWAQGFPTLDYAELEGGMLTPERGQHPRYAPPAGMREVGVQLARQAGLEVQCGVRVTRLERLGNGDGWRVYTQTEADEGVQEWQARRVLLNLPAPQAAVLLRCAAPAVAKVLSVVEYQPCWAVGAVLARDLPVSWPAAHVHGHAALDWISREHTKRLAEAGAEADLPTLMLHATPEWTRANLNCPPEEVTAELLAAAGKLLGVHLEATYTFAHRWLYALPTSRHSEAYLWDAGLGLGACGDGFTPDPHGARLEAAVLSGWALAEAVLSGP